MLIFNKQLCNIIVTSLIIFFVAITLSLTINVNDVNAFSSSSVKSIHGHLPYLTFDNGITKINDTDSLLGITLSDNTIIRPSKDVSSEDNPIILPNTADTFENIQTIVPLANKGNNNYPNVNLNTLIDEPYNYFIDEDGDSGAKVTGNISIKWKNYQSSPIYPYKIEERDITDLVKNNPKMKLNPCNGIYKLIINTTNGYIKTKYGLPNYSEFSDGNHTYYIKPNAEQAFVCYAQPNIVYHSGFEPGFYDGTTWTNYQGYRVFSPSNSGNYSGQSSITKNNFPSTGADGLYFYLTLAGIIPEKVVEINGNIIRSDENSNISLVLNAGKTSYWSASKWRAGSKNTKGKFVGTHWNKGIEPAVKVTLNGPKFDSTNKDFKPVTFKIYADKAKSQLLYEFRLMRWYIVQPEVEYENQMAAINYCQKLGVNYRLPDVNDFTNANETNVGWSNGFPGQGDKSARQLSYQDNARWIGGLFNEWGCLANGASIIGKDKYTNGLCSGYPSTNWDSYYYWTKSTALNSNDYGKGLLVFSGYGRPVLYDASPNYIRRVACVTP